MTHLSDLRTSGLWTVAAFVAFGCVVCCAHGQDIHPASNGAVQSVRAGMGQVAPSGRVGRTAGGEHAGSAGFGISETGAKVVSGRVAGYGARQVLGGLPEYTSLGSSGFGGGDGFSSRDFVATMPKPVFNSVFVPAAASKPSAGKFAVPAKAHARSGHTGSKTGLSSPGDAGGLPGGLDLLH